MNYNQNSSELTFSSLVEEAFINPIRSVAVIDDEYPTISGLLNSNTYENIDRKRLTEVIDFCREPRRNWTVDIDDGQSESEIGSPKCKSYLNSDLLILDYHLEKNISNGRSLKALNIISELALKPHFNMVVVHTGGYDDSIRSVILDIVAFLQACPKAPTFGRQSDDIEEFIDDYSITIDNPNFTKELLSTCNLEEFLISIREQNCLSKKYLQSEFFASFLKKFPEKNGKFNEVVLKKWFCAKKIEQYSSFFGIPIDGLDWFINSDATVNWIKASNIFITVIGKNVVQPALLPKYLNEALLDWCPHPHQLMLAKLRHEIDENGFKVANEIVDKKYLQSHWLSDLMKGSEKGNLDYKIWSVLSKHWEELATQTKDNIVSYFKKVMSYLEQDPEGKKDNFLKKWTLDEDIETIKQVNCFNCSKGIDGYHLNTGHILKLKEGNSYSYWVCMTPACDLEPNQKEFLTQSNMPITLVRLYDLKSTFSEVVLKEKLSNEQLETKALEAATRNNFIFIRTNESSNIEIFSFISNVVAESNPNSENFLISNYGKFENDLRELSLFRPGNKDGKPVFIEYEAKVVAQLRYEYALHLLQLTGRAKSRVGLDFVPYSSLPKGAVLQILPTSSIAHLEDGIINTEHLAANQMPSTNIPPKAAI